MDQDKKKNRKSRWGESAPALEHIIPCLQGFVISKKSSSLLQKRFDPPEIPKGFQPRGVKGKKSRFEPEKDDQLKSTNPTPDERRLVISTEKEREGKLFYIVKNKPFIYPAML